MTDVPWHPAVVHLPLGLALAAPVVALLVLISARGDRVGRWPRAIQALLQALIFAGAWVAMSTGQADEEIAERVVAHDLIHAHEDAGELFWIAAGVVLGVGLLALLVPAGRMAWWGTIAALLGTLAVAGFGVRAGLLGGELVYVHGAAGAHVEAQPPPAEPGEPARRD